VPGEDLPKVHHLFVEPYAYVRKDALVVGGGNSAAEAALFLSEEGARTTMAIWREDWENRDPKAGAMKHWVRTPLEAEVDAGRLKVVLYKDVVEIREHDVTLTTEDGESVTISNDVVFVLVGSEADLRMLKGWARFRFTIRRRMRQTYAACTLLVTLLTHGTSKRRSTFRAKSCRPSLKSYANRASPKRRYATSALSPIR